MSQLDLFQDLFVGRRTDFACQRPDGRYWRAGRSLTERDLHHHLCGEVTLGSYVIDEQGQCRFAVFDADMAQGLHLLRHLQVQFAGQGLPSYIEASRRGGHLWLFFVEPRLASQVRAWLLPFCPSEVELYPKQGEGVGYGSLIRLPLGIHQRSGKRYPFVNWTTKGFVAVAPSVATTLSWLTTIQRVSAPAVQVARPSVLTRPAGSMPANRSGSPLTIREWCREQDPLRVIGGLVDLNRQGVGHCPFGWHHTDGVDTHASLKVYQPRTPGGSCWYCYRWQHGGNVFDFLCSWHHLDARELWQRLRRGERP